MITIREKLEDEIDWIIKELTKLKLIPHRNTFSESEREIYFKSIVPMIYAYLEGYVKKSFKIYVEFVNELNLKLRDFSPKLQVYILEKKYNFFITKIEDLQRKENLILNILATYDDENIKLVFDDKKVQNINCDRLNKLLIAMNFQKIDDQKLGDKLNKLLQYRNGIAHGENSYMVKENLIFEFIDTVTSTMDILSDMIVKGFEEKNYLNEDKA